MRATLNVAAMVFGLVAVAALFALAWSEVGEHSYSLRVAVTALMALLVIIAMRRGLERLE